MAIKLIVLDVDGCLSDGLIYYGADGDELKAFDVKDGLAIASWIRLGGEVAIITGRHSKIVQRRADELGIKHCYQGVRDKKERLVSILDTLALKPQEVAAIGDDLNDAQMLSYVGRSYAPLDAVAVIRELVDHPLSRPGGRGAVREMIEDILIKEGLWQEFLNLWLVA